MAQSEILKLKTGQENLHPVPWAGVLGTATTGQSLWEEASDTPSYTSWVFVHFIFLSISLCSLVFWLYVFYLINAVVTYYFCYFNNNDN